MKKTINTNSSSEVDPFYWNEENFSKVFDEYYSSLCFFSNKYLEDMDLARSLVQEVFVDLWTKRENIALKYSVKSYLYTAVKNRSIDYLRTVRKNVKLSAVGDCQLETPFRDALEEAELNDRINKSINELPEKCREVFVLCRFEGLKYSQIAEKLNISVKTVEMQMGIALKKMREKLSDIQLVKLLLCIFSKKK
ncbi:RNA polymerase sigma-70 factor [Gaoshiqia sediminis]|uniref:RNA polymerase sigma-70 factor n=1 Tax=Gaoshiqia sediminis TaxID=2986998 RepID=A0AA41YAZ6_9BACT|nr:RNA polymerase sigma-70 factor [Gaoshiqia sediminis]MCW0481317.1 RNA polymerase sigma-70 factor [Gaoshiqia sediminis]